MQIQVKLFAMLQEALGETVTVEVPATPSAEEIKGAVSQIAPNLKQMIQTSRLAVNQEFTTNAPIQLQSTDEVALIPPVSGG
ncbi:MoaD/ThiS family protein [Secundilactobacillus odoratitofui]|nr:MoaD/ThiS family protein [Secundilactobacillus odoratitofui]